MVCVSKIAVQCPSTSCDFSYFASSPDPACKLRSHFNNLKVRDVHHQAFFQKPYCVFCGKIISSKTRKGLWKSAMNTHWLLDHASEFEEISAQHEERDIEIAVILSPSQLKRLCDEWQVECEFEEGDLITRKGRATRLHEKLTVATPRPPAAVASPQKRQKTFHDQGRFDAKEMIESMPGDRIYVLPSHHSRSMSLEQESMEKDLRLTTSTDLVGSKELKPQKGHSMRRDKYPVNMTENRDSVPHTINCGHCGEATGHQEQGHIHLPTVDSYSTDAFAALSFCFHGFENDGDL